MYLFLSCVPLSISATCPSTQAFLAPFYFPFFLSTKVLIMSKPLVLPPLVSLPFHCQMHLPKTKLGHLTFSSWYPSAILKPVSMARNILKQPEVLLGNLTNFWVLVKTWHSMNDLPNERCNHLIKEYCHLSDSSAYECIWIYSENSWY